MTKKSRNRACRSSVASKPGDRRRFTVKALYLGAAVAAGSACKSVSSPDGAALKVTNGLAATGSPDIVKIDEVFLITATGGELSYPCTGTLVASNLVLTAAHCVVVDGLPGYKLKSYSVHGVKPVSQAVHPAFNAQGNNATSDLAFVIFPKSLSESLGVTAFRPIRTAAPYPGEAVYIVGYGETDFNQPYSVGTKYWGSNKIQAVGSGFFTIEGLQAGPGTGTNVSSAHGDSGGPVIDALTGAIVGVVQSGVPKGANIVGSFVDLTSPSSRSFIKSSLDYAAQDAAIFEPSGAAP